MCPENLGQSVRFEYNYSPQLLIMSEIFMANAHVRPLSNKDICVCILLIDYGSFLTTIQIQNRLINIFKLILLINMYSKHV